MGIEKGGEEAGRGKEVSAPRGAEMVDGSTRLPRLKICSKKSLTLPREVCIISDCKFVTPSPTRGIISRNSFPPRALLFVFIESRIERFETYGITV